MPQKFTIGKSVSFTPEVYFVASAEARRLKMSIRAFVSFCIEQKVTDESRREGADMGKAHRVRVHVKQREESRRKRAEIEVDKNPPQKAGGTVLL